MESLRKFLILFLSLFVIGGIFYGVRQAIHSPLFYVQTVEVLSSMENPPIHSQGILRMANVPLDKVSLFELDLKPLEQRLLANSQIQSVKLIKRLPHTIVISIKFREPRAIIQNKKGDLSYVDDDGKVFSPVDLTRAADLPILTNFSSLSQEKIKEALHLLSLWERSSLKRLSLVSSVEWDVERGFRFLIAYPLGIKDLTSEGNLNNRVRAVVDFGQLNSYEIEEKLVQLSKVLHYLKGNSIAVRRVWADVGKKIVVKTVHGS